MWIGMLDRSPLDCMRFFFNAPSAIWFTSPRNRDRRAINRSLYCFISTFFIGSSGGWWRVALWCKIDQDLRFYLCAQRVSNRCMTIMRVRSKRPIPPNCAGVQDRSVHTSPYVVYGFAGDHRDDATEADADAAGHGRLQRDKAGDAMAAADLRR